MNAWYRVGAVAALAVLATACSKQDRPGRTGTGADQPHRVDAGVHRVSVRVPPGWEVREEADQAVIRTASVGDAEQRALDRKGELPTKDVAEVRLRDLGPVTPAGMQQAVAAARELWRDGHVAEAKALLRSAPLRSELLPSLAPPSDFARAWSRLRHAPESAPYDNVAADLAMIIAGLGAAPPPALSTVVDWGLPRVDATRLSSLWQVQGGKFDGEENDANAGRPDARRRDVVWRKTVQVDGCEAEEIETFDNLTHAFRRRLLFLVNDQHLLVVASEAGGREHSIRGYETIRASLQLTR
jgi:hypothetical protein